MKGSGTKCRDVTTMMEDQTERKWKMTWAVRLYLVIANIIRRNQLFLFANLFGFIVFGEGP